MKKKFFEEINDLFQNVELNRMNSKILMTTLSAIVLSSCGDGKDKGSEENDKTKASQFREQHEDLYRVLQEAFKNKTYDGKTGDKALVNYINSLNSEELKNLSKFSKKELETKLNSLKNGNDFNESKFKESLSKPSNKNENGKNANGNGDVVKQVNAVDPNSAENLKEDEGKKKEEEEKKLLADIEKILNHLSEDNKSAKEKIIEYFKFLSEIGEQSIEKSFIEEYNKRVNGAENEENVIAQLKQTLNNVFSNENQKKDLFNKLSEKVKKYVTDKLEDEVKKKVNVKATSAKKDDNKDDNIETTILYSEKANDKNVINDNKQFYVIEEIDVTNSKTNKVEKIKIVVANSNEDDTLEKYEIPDLNNLVVDKKEKLKEVIESYGKKLINDEPVDISKFTGLNLKDLLSKVSDFYKKLIEGKDSDDKMIIENFDKKQWIQVFNNKEDEFKKFIIKESVAIIKEYYKDLPEGTEKDKLDTCSKILFGEVLNYYEDKSKCFVSIKDFYKHSDKTTLHGVSQYNGKIPMFTKSNDKDTDDIFNTYRNKGKAPLYCLFNYELCKQYCDVFAGMLLTNGGIVISTKGESDGVNSGDQKDFISPRFNEFRVGTDLGIYNNCPNMQYSGTSKNFRDGMDEALDASFKSLQLVESNGSAKNLRTLFFQYLDQMTPQQMDSITDDSFVKWMNQNNIYMSVDSMKLDCINKFCDIFFNKFFGGKEKVKAFMDAIKNETNVSGFDKTDKDKVNTAITNIQNSQKEYLDSLKNGEYTKYWYGLLTDTVLKAKS